MSQNATTFDDIKVLYNDPNMQLWGLPFEMRPYQAPRHFADNKEGWVWLGSPGWYGSMPQARIAETRAFLANCKSIDAIPTSPGEWSRIADFQ